MKQSSFTSTASADSSQRLLLRVDGRGCLLLLQRDEIRVGGIDSDNPIEIKLQTGGIDSPIAISRDGDRYLARSDIPFRVDGRRFESKLLFCGETFELGQRGRVRFHKPVPASATAVLQPTAAGLVDGDIRYVVLMTESLLFGASGTHFPLTELGQSVLLACFEGQYLLRRLHDQDAGSGQSHVPLPFDEPTFFEGVHFVLQTYDETRRSLLA